jgi:hypothetical protein
MSKHLARGKTLHLMVVTVFDDGLNVLAERIGVLTGF